MITINLIYLLLIGFSNSEYISKNIIVFENSIKNLKYVNDDIYGMVIRNYSSNIFDFSTLLEIDNENIYYLEISNNNVFKIYNPQLIKKSVRILNFENTDIKYFDLSYYIYIKEIILSENDIYNLYINDGLTIEYIYMDNLKEFDIQNIIENINKLELLKKISLKNNNIYSFTESIDCNNCIVDLSDNYITTIENFNYINGIIYLYNNCIYNYTNNSNEIYISQCDKNDTFDKCIDVYGYKNYISTNYCNFIKPSNKTMYVCRNYLIDFKIYVSSKYIDFCIFYINIIKSLFVIYSENTEIMINNTNNITDIENNINIDNNIDIENNIDVKNNTNIIIKNNTKNNTNIITKNNIDIITKNYKYNRINNDQYIEDSMYILLQVLLYIFIAITVLYIIMIYYEKYKSTYNK